MWRYLAGGVAALLLAAVGVILFTGRAKPGSVLLAAAPPPTQAGQSSGGSALPDTVPEASDRTREQKRFDRYDKDHDSSVTREEYLASRRKAFAKLDINHDGMLSFDEWSAKTEAKFATADRDHSGALNAAEFAATAVKRKTRPLKRNCPPAASAPASVEGDDG